MPGPNPRRQSWPAHFIGVETARKQAEAERQILNQRLRDLQFYTRFLTETSVDALLTTDPRGIITDVNQQIPAPAKKKRRKFSKAQREAAAERMRQRWAAKKKAFLALFLIAAPRQRGEKWINRQASRNTTSRTTSSRSTARCV